MTTKLQLPKKGLAPKRKPRSTSKLQILDVQFYVRHRKVWAKLKIGSVRLPFSTSITLSEPNSFDPKELTAKGNPELSSSLALIKDKAFSIWKAATSQKKSLSLEGLRDQLIDDLNLKTTITPTFLQRLDQYITEKNELAKSGEIEEKTAYHFGLYARHIHEFLNDALKVSDLKFTEVKPAMANDLIQYLSGKRCFSQSHVRKTFWVFSQVLSYAVRQDWIDKNPFLGIKFKRKRTIKKFLQKHQLDQLEVYPFSNDTLQRVADCFVFSAYTGMAYADYSRLSPLDIRCDDTGTKYILIHRKKTDTPSFIPLLPKAEAIIKKYETHPYCLKNKVVLPVLSNQKMNSNLKLVTELLGFSIQLTTHIGRKTFATLMLNNGVSVKGVAQALGHKNTRTTEDTYAEYLPETLKNEFKKVSSTL